MKCGLRIADCGIIVRMFLRPVVMVLFSIVCYASAASAAEKWSGVDETVVEKIAKEHGREAHEPLINTDRGDLLLFVFLIAGTAGGFAAGYYWRMLVVEKAPSVTEEKRSGAQAG